MIAENSRRNDANDTANARLLASKALEAKKLEKAAKRQVVEAKAEYVIARRNYKRVRRVAKLTRKEAKLAAKAIGVKVKALIRTVEQQHSAPQARAQANAQARKPAVKARAHARKAPVRARPVVAHSIPKKPAPARVPTLPAHLINPSADGAKGVSPAAPGM